MTDLTIGEITLPTAEVGGANPLPPLFAGGNLDKTADLAAATDEIRRGAGYGRVASISPYLLQDRYTRRRAPRPHRVAVLENEHLRATFLLDAGGRLWSLVHRSTGRELLFANPVFQPANLALRNAWFAGGVEWNIGTIGHTPLTCEPLHAARVTADDGTPVLRMYEFERLRRVVYQLDVHLPEGSAALYVHVRITNPNAHEVPMYWWSNIAVPQTGDTRVLAPADRAWNYSYDNVLRHEPVAGTAPGSTTGGAPGSAVGGAPGGDEPAGTSGPPDAPDISYPGRFDDAADFFFDLAGAARPFVAAVQGDGSGIFQASTRELTGRKLFRWGTGPGGRRWQEWLSGADRDSVGGYAEIQAGLARTQFEHLPMPPGARWSWTEAYGRIALTPPEAHGPWGAAREAAARAVGAAVPADILRRVDERARELAERAPAEALHTGSGWGALERRLRSTAGEPAVDAPATPFPDSSLGAEQQPWLDLLERGVYPEPPAGSLPGSVLLHPVVDRLLTASPGWAAPALLGVNKACAGDLDGAVQAWRLSIERHDNAYARRNIACAEVHRRRFDEAVTQYLAALAVGGARRTPLAEPLRATGPEPAHPALVVEALGALLASGDARRTLDVVDSLPLDARTHGRVRVAEARAALAVGDLERCGAILSDTGLEVADLREGEESLDALWIDYRTRRVAAERGVAPDAALRAEVAEDGVPAHLDFRMRT